MRTSKYSFWHHGENGVLMDSGIRIHIDNIDHVTIHLVTKNHIAFLVVQLLSHV